MILKKSKINPITVFCYILILVNFIGVNFLKINIIGINMNLGRILMFVSAIIIIVYSIINKNIKVIIAKSTSVVKSVSIFLLIWLIFSLISFIRTEDILNTIINEFFLIFGTMSIFLIICEIKERDFKNILKLVEIAMIINCIYALILYYALQEKTFGGFYYNVNDLATFFLYGIPAEIALIYIEKENKGLFITRILIVALEMYIFYLLDSRACNLGMILGTLSIILCVLYKKNDKIKKSVKFLKEKKQIFIPIYISIIMIVIIARINPNN